MIDRIIEFSANNRFIVSSSSPASPSPAGGR